MFSRFAQFGAMFIREFSAFVCRTQFGTMFFRQRLSFGRPVCSSQCRFRWTFSHMAALIFAMVSKDPSNHGGIIP
jgi:hypothetical protein